MPPNNLMVARNITCFLYSTEALMTHKFYCSHCLIITRDMVKTNNNKPSHGSSFPAMKQANLLLREYSYGTPATVSSLSRTSLAWSGSAVSHSSS